MAIDLHQMVHININRGASVVIRFPQPRHRDFTLHSTWELIRRKTRKPPNRIPDVMQKKSPPPRAPVPGTIDDCWNLELPKRPLFARRAPLTPDKGPLEVWGNLVYKLGLLKKQAA